MGRRWEQETVARELVKTLRAAGVTGRAAGEGVHWQVDVGPVGARALVVHCFWYERAISGLMLGMNPANARTGLRAQRAPYEGPEYFMILHDAGARIADGRTRQVVEAVACARAWLAGADLDRLAREAPFVDEKGRAMRALAARLNPALRHQIFGDPSYELWVYGDGRSCKVAADDDGAISCSFLLGQAQVARGAVVDDVPAAVETWLVGGVSLRALATRVPGVELERHAEVLESDPARWHWLHFRDRIADPRDALAPLRALIEALADSPVASTFFTYSSLNRLCFSASSHYPWVDAGLPVVMPTEHGDCLVGEYGWPRVGEEGVRSATRCDFRRALPIIEGMLAASPVRPFFGSEPHHHLTPLLECFARQGSPVRPGLVQTGAWYNLVVADAAGARSCTMGQLTATFEDTSGTLSARWPTVDDAVRAVRRYLEDGATLAELADNSGAEKIFQRGPAPRA